MKLVKLKESGATSIIEFESEITTNPIRKSRCGVQNGLKGYPCPNVDRLKDRAHSAFHGACRREPLGNGAEA